jgi:hypothetical protein
MRQWREREPISTCGKSAPAQQELKGCHCLIDEGRRDMAMKLGDFLKKVEGMDPDTILCVSEVDEAFASEIAQVDIVEDARQRSPDADDQEAIELANGTQTAVVLRW